VRRVAEQTLELTSRDEPIWIRVHAPEHAPSDRSWRCRLEISTWPGAIKYGYGATPMQALSLSISVLAILLYASPKYKNGEPSLDGRPNGDLGIPAQHLFLDEAPYPFSTARVRAHTRLAVVGGAELGAGLLAEEAYAVAGSRRKLRARIYAPRPTKDGRTWACDVSVTAPLGMRGQGLGPSSLQAVVAGLAILSQHLYGSSLLTWAHESTGLPSERDDHLLLPAVTEFLDVAPYPFRAGTARGSCGGGCSTNRQAISG
jgi:hypothetical protein